MRHMLHTIVLVAIVLALPTHLCGQRPCADTLVRIYDTTCEGQQYHFNGRVLTYGGLYYDTLPRAAGGCDSVVILHLAMLEYPFALPGSQVQCTQPYGYHINVLAGGSSMYYRWNATPPDSTLVGQEHSPLIFVSPAVPTTYDIYVDYRPEPQCPSTGRIELNPVQPVVAQMYVSPDYLSYDHLELNVEDYSIGQRGTLYGGWNGRKWYLNGQLQDLTWSRATFPINPSMQGDSVEVKMVAFTSTCSDHVVKVVPFRRVALYFPNVFTPGREPGHLFQPILQGLLQYELWIYNRQGTLVFHTAQQAPWDGTYHGSPCPPGTYVYKCRYSDLEDPGGYQNLAGTVTLLR